MSVDIAGFVTDLKEHATEHGFHVHDERISSRPTPCASHGKSISIRRRDGGPIDLHVALDVDPKVILSLREALDEMDSDFEEPENVYHLDLFFNWAVPPLHSPPDLLVLATDLAGLAGVTLPVEVSAIDSYGAVTDAPERRLTLTGRASVSLVDVLMGLDQLCDVLDRSHEVSEYLLDRVGGWMELPS